MAKEKWTTVGELIGGAIGLTIGGIIGAGVGLATGGTAIAGTVPAMVSGGGIGAFVGRKIENIFGGEPPKSRRRRRRRKTHKGDAGPVR